jgi:hypothetical protein
MWLCERGRLERMKRTLPRALRAECACRQVCLQVRQLAELPCAARSASAATRRVEREEQGAHEPERHRAREDGPVLAVRAAHVRRAGGVRGRVERVREHEAWFACRASVFGAAGRERTCTAEAPVVAGAA